MKSLDEQAEYLTGSVPMMWDGGRSYIANDIVFDREGVWFALNDNVASEPVCGNADWQLISGQPYVDIHIVAANIAIAPFYAATPTPPGVTVLDAPGANLIAMPVAVWSIVSDGDPWYNEALIRLWWNVPGNDNAFDIFNSTIDDALDMDLSIYQKFTWFVQWIFLTGTPIPPVAINVPVVLQAVSDASGGGSQIGTRSITYRVFYRILPAILT